jgi:hypothetical protein
MATRSSAALGRLLLLDARCLLLLDAGCLLLLDAGCLLLLGAASRSETAGLGIDKR